MSVPSHHWSRDRHIRKMRLLDFIKKSPGIDDRKLMGTMTKKLVLSPRMIREYLSELEFEDEIESRDGKFYPSGYEESQMEGES